MKQHDNGTIEAFDSDYRQSDAFVLEIIASLEDVINTSKKIVQTPSLTMGCFYNLGAFKILYDATFVKNGLTFVFNVSDGGYPQTIRFQDDANSSNYFEVGNTGTVKYLGSVVLRNMQTALLNKTVTISFSSPTGIRPCVLGMFSGYARVVKNLIDFDYTGETASVYDKTPFNSAEYTSHSIGTDEELEINGHIKNITSKIYCGSKDLNNVNDYYHYTLVGTFIGDTVNDADGQRNVKCISNLEYMDGQKVSLDDAHMFSHTQSHTTEYYLDYFFGNQVKYNGLCMLDDLMLPNADILYLEVLTQICKHNGLSFWEDNEAVIRLTNFKPEEKNKTITYDELRAFLAVESVKNTYDIVECSLPKYYTSDYEQVKMSCTIRDLYGNAKIYMDEDGKCYIYDTLQSYNVYDIDFNAVFGENYQSVSLVFSSNGAYNYTSYSHKSDNAYSDLIEYLFLSLLIDDDISIGVELYESEIIISFYNLNIDSLSVCVVTTTGILFSSTYAKPFTEKTYKYKKLLQGSATSTNIYKLDLNTAPYLAQYVKVIDYISNDFNSKNKAVTLQYISDLTLDLHDGLYIPYDGENAVMGHITKNVINYNGGITQILTCDVKNYSPYDCQTFASTTLKVSTSNILFTGG